jgi:hypothetical protein
MSDRSSTPAPYRIKRRHSRACLPATAALFTDRRPLGPFVVLDISAGGICLVGGAPLRRGRVVTVLLDVPGEALSCVAQVSRHEARGPGEHVIALSFLDLRRAEIERLEALVARLIADSHPCLEFFDTDDNGKPRRVVLGDDAPVIG